MERPPYFAEVEEEARLEWDRLAIPKNAGVYQQLFDQVKDPQLVVSELLQNADDAQATYARVSLEGDTFVFEHDGGDFTREQFASLCWFGYSNKRVLHTIGFRGIGFKSAFSVGDVVRLQTATLDVEFKTERFFQPVWRGEAVLPGVTRVSVKCRDAGARRAIEQSISEWRAHPLSLLFLSNVSRLDLDGVVVARRLLEGHPGGGQRWILAADKELEYSVFTSEESALPAEAQAEIRSTRRASEDYEIPPAKVTIVLGTRAEHRIFTILPTNTKTDLPFAINAPFLQQPDRRSIKSPETSPTNQWLLKTAGVLAANAMHAWLNDTSLEIGDRVGAYDLLPVFTSPELEGVDFQTDAAVSNAFTDTFDERPVLLTTMGTLALPNEATSIPAEFRHVWPDEVWRRSFRPGRTTDLIAEEVNERTLKLLADWSWLTPTTTEGIIHRLRTSPSFPAPTAITSLWKALQAAIVEEHTWNYSAAKHETTYSFKVGDSKIDPRSLYVVPRVGSTDLHRADKIIRMPRELTEWTRKYVSSRLETTDLGTEADDPSVAVIAGALGLTRAHTRGGILSRLIALKENTVEAIVGLAFVAADLDVEAPDDMPYVTRSNHRRTVEAGVFSDHTGLFTRLLGESANDVCIAQNYDTPSPQIEAVFWKWWKSGKPRIMTSITLQKVKVQMSGYDMRKHLDAQGLNAVNLYAQFTGASLEDYDLHPAILPLFEAHARSDPLAWVTLLKEVIGYGLGDWERKPRLTESNYQNSRSVHLSGELIPIWLTRFRSKPCLLGVDGKPHLPSELARRTAETQVVADLLTLVEEPIDTGANSRVLDALGVQSTIRDPKRVLDGIATLARGARRADDVVVAIANRIRMLEAIIEREPGSLYTIKARFDIERMVPTSDPDVPFETSTRVCLDARDGAYGIPQVHGALRELTFWKTLDVPPTATVDQLLEWTNSLPNSKLPEKDVSRLKRALKGYAQAIADQTGNWLTLSAEWKPVKDLEYYAVRRDSASIQGIAESHASVIADCTMFADRDDLPASAQKLTPISAALTYQYDMMGSLRGEPSACRWANLLGEYLLRAKRTAEGSQMLAARLRDLSIAEYEGEILATPMLNGVVAGPAKPVLITWQDNVLRAPHLRWGKIGEEFIGLAEQVTRERTVLDALRACTDRSDAFIADYFEENFPDLSDAPAVPQPAPKPELARVEQPSIAASTTSLKATTTTPDVTGRGESPAPNGSQEVETRTRPGDSSSGSDDEEIEETETPAAGSMGDESAPHAARDEKESVDQLEADASETEDEEAEVDEEAGDEDDEPSALSGDAKQDETLVRTHRRRVGGRRSGNKRPNTGPRAEDTDVEGDDEEQEEGDEEPTRRRLLFHAYACGIGFAHDEGSNSYLHPDGRRFTKSSLGDWECIGGPPGSPQYYFVAAGSYREGIHLPTAVWSLLMKFPDNTVLVTESKRRPALAHTGAELKRLTNADSQLNAAPTGFFLRGDVEADSA